MVKKKATVKKKSEDDKVMPEEKIAETKTMNEEETKELKKEILDKLMKEKDPETIDEIKEQELATEEFDIANLEGVGNCSKE